MWLIWGVIAVLVLGWVVWSVVLGREEERTQPTGNGLQLRGAKWDGYRYVGGDWHRY